MVLSVNGEVVDDERIRVEERVLRARLMQAMPRETPAAIEARAKDWARENVVDEILLKQAVAADPEITKKLTAKLAPPKQKEITEYYKKNRASLYRPEMVSAEHVIVLVPEGSDEAEALEKIRGFERQLAEGVEFGALEGYEDLGQFPRGRMVPEFESVVFAMQPGSTSPVFRTRFGYHIVRVRARRGDGIPELNEIREEIEARLTYEKHRRAVDRYVDQLRATADIRMD